jgi:DNA invertase Pin-like site-specific DNA recombinase
MRAAIYARKSNDDNDKNPENKAVENQKAGARRFIEKQGWTLDEDYIFVDDGISGAECVNRPGLARLLASLKHFDVLVMSESARLGHDMTRNATVMMEIIEAGKRIFYYFTGEEEKADSPEQKSF